MITGLEPKDPDVPATYSIVWHELIVEVIRRDWQYSDGAIARPDGATGYLYQASILGGEAFGRTSAHTPGLPRALGAAKTDGTVIWTAIHPADSAVPVVDTAVWTLPSGIAKASQDEVGIITYVTLTGGTLGQDYPVTCTMTPTVGDPIEKTLLVRVRAQ